MIHLPHLQLPLDFSIVIQNANENVLDVNVESNVQHTTPSDKTGTFNVPNELWNAAFGG